MEEGSKWKGAPFGRGLRVEESSVWKKDPARPGSPARPGGPARLESPARLGSPVRPRAGPVGGP